MKEIKFRAWDKQRNEFLSAGEIFLGISPGSNPEMAFYLDIIQAQYINRNRFTLMQYIGLKDKKQTKEYPEGQEIYEGDICKDHDGINVPVEIHTGAAWIGIYLALDENEKCEIVGNIYENPELLNDKNSF